MDEPIKITATFTGNNTKVTPPYNPFIIINSEESRGLELHLSGKLPTDLFTGKFGLEDDRSRPEDGLYYVADDNYVFAVDVASSEFK